MNFHSKCLFCKEVFVGNRNILFEHMVKIHHFHVGSPDNMVNIHQFLSILREKLDNCICIYCEKTFKNHSVLKLHMKKKKHVKINPNNKIYDQFYLINYLVIIFNINFFFNYFILGRKSKLENITK